MSVHSGNYSFLPVDLEGLDRKICYYQEMEQKIKREAGDSCRQTAETYHDNFMFEQSKRNLEFNTSMLNTLDKIKGFAVLVQPTAQIERVEIGNWVSFRCREDGTEDRLCIGSYRTYRDEEAPDVVSYDSPLGNVLLGRRVGEATSPVVVGRASKTYIVQSIEL